ncbi:protein FAR1-RELATED SEQUENCE 5-like isoform X2 [Tasmannia lanceolata]|uniref:protein FAR1-RELATED SEQUENCE 5-like isoform X2 n=1 Tax=Tasmannia lanceolata TaxID=3420 RepID=UPI0040644F64
MESGANEGNESIDSHIGDKVDLTECEMVVDIEHDVAEENKMEEHSVKMDLTTSEGEEPLIGMEFESQNDARLFYNAYARRVGFGTRISYSHRSRRDRKLIAQQYVCVKEGFCVSKEGATKQPRSSTRIGCKASMTVKKINPGKWVVKSFEKDHNHELASPTEVQFLRSHRDMCEVVGNSTADMQSGGTNNIGSKEECTNFVAGSHHKKLAVGDAQAALDFFNHMQNEDPSFFYAIQVDKDDRMINAFWIDGRSRMAYEYFGDVVIFDTTYIVNKYCMPLASFLGVNHHGRSVLFGCALLADETESSFVWLFKTWLTAMSGRLPTSIITDQDRVIQTAVAEVFPETCHRFGIWCILRDFSNKLGDICKTHKNLEHEFRNCINQTETIDEFESCWGSLLDTFDLRENNWLQLLYEDRHYWVPAYLKGIFSAEMFTSQGTNDINSIFDECVNVDTSLEEFFREYSDTLDSQYNKEVQADFDTIYNKSNFKTSSPMEKQVATLYTVEIFSNFQIELFECFGYIANKIAEDGAINIYIVAKFGEEKKAYTVTLNVSEMTGTCSCQMFEFSGILCRHILSVFNITNVSMLPPYYILKRWTRNAKSTVMLNESNVEVQGNSRQSMMLRYNNICHRSIKVAVEGARSIESYNLALHALQVVLEEVVSINESVVGPPQLGTPVCESNHQERINRGGQADNQMNASMWHNSHHSKAKGRLSSSRLKPGPEKETRRMNTCNTCMKPGHNSRTCPTLTNMGFDIIGDIQMANFDWDTSVPTNQCSMQGNFTSI